MQRGTKSHLKIQSHLMSQFPPEMASLNSQQNFQSCLKSNFLFTPKSNICFLKHIFDVGVNKVFKMTGVKLTIGRFLLKGIYWYQSTNRRFIHSHLFIHSHKGDLAIGLMVKSPLWECIDSLFHMRIIVTVTKSLH